MISLLLIITAAFFNACMDAFENENFHESIFRGWNQKFWYKRESWKHARKVFGYKVDAWHLAKSAMIISMCLAVITYEPVAWWPFELIVAGIAWIMSFNFFYHQIFRIK